jgi:hypothetical protein
LLWQWKGKPNITALVRSLGLGAQLCESSMWALLVGAQLPMAQGRTLGLWGKIVGETQGALTHEEYRMFITLRGQVNSTYPSESNVYTLLSTALAPSLLEMVPVSNGAYYIVTSIDWTRGQIASHTARLIADYRAIGHWCAVVEIRSDDQLMVGSVASPGPGVIGSLSSPSPDLIGRVIYDGRTRG